jgi:hypothetical protein
VPEDSFVAMAIPTSRRIAAWTALLSSCLHAADPLPEALQGVNPDKLSGGLFAALDAAGHFGARPELPRTRAGYPDVSKGRAPLVLDARVGVNLRLGEDPSSLPANQRGQAEPHLVRSTANPDVILATHQEGRYPDSGAIACGYALSRDGGLGWTRGLIPNLTTVTGGKYLRATDPVAGAGPQGELYLQTLAAVQGVFGLSAVVLSRSFDGGITWQPPSTIFESSSGQVAPDKNWLAVNDFPGTANSGRLVATWTQFLRTPTGMNLSNPVVAAVSDDRGATWTTPIEITPPGSNNQGTQPVFLPDGSLLVVYITFLEANNVTRFRIEAKRSLDGGRTFPTAAVTVVESVAGWDDAEMRDGVFLPSLAVARQTGDAFVTYTAVVNGSPRVVVTKSSDRGATWSTPIIASDQPAGISVMNPAIAVTPDGRTVSVAFMDKRHAPNGVGFVDHSVAQSFDGGATWQPKMSSDIRFGPSTTRGIMLGDYMAVAPALAADQPCIAIWCDTRTGDSDPFTVRFTPANEETFQAWRIARFSRGELASSQTGALGDFDADGFSNAAEYLFQTDPRRRESGTAFDTAEIGPFFQIAFRARGPAQLEFPTRLERSIDGVEWTAAGVVSPRILQSTDNELSITGASLGSPTRFRLSLLDPATGTRAALSDPLAGFSNSRLVNVSSRGRVGSGASQLIVGFTLDGPKSILVRAAGPALAAVGVSGALSDPRLNLEAPASDLFRANDNWQQSQATAALFARLGALPFASNSLDAALLLELGPQSYTAIVSGANDSGGIAVVEAYDADPVPGAPAQPRFVNLSTRGFAGSGNDALIAGFVVSGSHPRRVLLRAIGPSLGKFGVSGALADPMLTLFQDGAAIASNDDWEISRSAMAVGGTATRVGAFPLAAGSLDAALLLTLSPGAYTAMVGSSDGATGIALVELYDLN